MLDDQNEKRNAEEDESEPFRRAPARTPLLEQFSDCLADGLAVRAPGRLGLDGFDHLAPLLLIRGTNFLDRHSHALFQFLRRYRRRKEGFRSSHLSSFP